MNILQHIHNLRLPSSASRVHFVSASGNYAGVNKDLSHSIAQHLRSARLSASRLYRPDALNVTFFVRQPADVIMSHGAADKNYLFQREHGQMMLNRFKHVLVPGAWLKSRILQHPEITLPPSHVHVVGWPRLDLLIRQNRKSPPGSMNARKRVLWAPTHDGRLRGPEAKSTSSYPDFQQHLPMLGKHFEVLTSLHPRNRKNKTPTFNELLKCDYVVSDFGTLVYEAWALGKPVFFPRWILGDRIQKYLPGSAEAFIFEHRIGYHPESIDEMIDAMYDTPFVDQKVEAFLELYLPRVTRGESGQAIAGLLLSLATRAVPTVN